MKHGAVTKTSQEKQKTSKKLDDNVILENCDVITFFTIYGQFRAIWKPDYRGIVCKTYIFINSNLLSYTN